MRGMDLGLEHFKFFPAEASGGLPALKSLIGPFYNCKFCPTGGIRQDNAADWLAVPEILCVGGSWLVAKGAPDVAAIEAAARAATALAR
jgi:2-dehydro-3-deoxyphosphogluconate aldolase/(4S)-4-hydroxy-2-oxoglutarate aldolase